MSIEPAFLDMYELKNSGKNYSIEKLKQIANRIYKSLYFAFWLYKFEHERENEYFLDELNEFITNYELRCKKSISIIYEKYNCDVSEIPEKDIEHYIQDLIEIIYNPIPFSEINLVVEFKIDYKLDEVISRSIIFDLRVLTGFTSVMRSTVKCIGNAKYTICLKLNSTINNERKATLLVYRIKERFQKIVIADYCKPIITSSDFHLL